MHHAGVLVAGERLARLPCRQLPRRGALPVDLLAPHGGDLHCAHPFGDGAEGGAGLDRLQLLAIAHQHQLGARGVHRCQHALHLPRTDHAGLVNDQHVARAEQLEALRPGTLPARDRPAGDPRPGLQSLGGDPRQRRPAHRVALPFPGLARGTQHRALAAAGVADHHGKVARPRHVPEGQTLLLAQRAAGQQRATPPEAHRVRRAPRQGERRRFHAPLDRHHLARREPRPPVAVRADAQQLGRGLDLRHDRRELRRTVAVPVHQLREVRARERALLLRQRLQCQLRVSQQPLAVAARDRAMLLGALGVLAAHRATGAGRADLVLRLEVEAARGVRAVIDANVLVHLGQPDIDQLGPARAPDPQQRLVVPAALLEAETRLLRMPLSRHDPPHRQHDVRMRLRLAVGGPAPMHVQVGHHAARDELLAGEVAHQPDRLALAQLARQGELDLARQHRVAAALDALHLVPQRGAVQPARRRPLRQQDLGMHEPGLGEVVERAAEALVVQRSGGPVGRRRNRAAPLRALDHLRAEMVDRHAPAGPLSASLANAGASRK